METEYLYPKVFDRTTSDDWETRGSADIRGRARDITLDLLSQHCPVYIDDEVDARLRDHFPISLPP